MTAMVQTQTVREVIIPKMPVLVPVTFLGRKWHVSADVFFNDHHELVMHLGGLQGCISMANCAVSREHWRVLKEFLALLPVHTYPAEWRWDYERTPVAYGLYTEISAFFHANAAAYSEAIRCWENSQNIPAAKAGKV